MNDDRDPGRSDLHRRRRSRNWALFVALLALIALFYAITIVRMGRL